MKKIISILLCAMMTLSVMLSAVSCNGFEIIEDVTEEKTNPTTEKITTGETEIEKITITDVTTTGVTTAEIITAEITTAEITTAEVTTEEITTEEITTEEITTEEITTEEVTTEEETLDELSAAIKECNDIFADSKMLADTMLVYYDELMGNSTAVPGLITYKNLINRYKNYTDAIAIYEKNLPNAQYKDSYDKYKAVEEYAVYRNSDDAEEQALYQEYLEVKDLYKSEYDLYVKYEKALTNKNDTLQNYLIVYMQMFLNQEIECSDSRFLKVKDILSMAEELDRRIYNAHNSIEIIAKYEGDTIVYINDETKCVFYIVDTDSYSDVTKNAIESVLAAHDNIYLASFLENTEIVQHYTDVKMQNFASYDENGNIPDVTVKETYYVLFDDGLKFDADGNDISEKDIAFTGTSVSNYRYFEILDVTDTTYKGDGTNGTVKNRWYYTLTLNGKEVTVPVINYEGGKVVLVPIGEEQVTDTIYRNIRNTGEWYYYSKDADGNIADYYLRSEDGSYTKITAVEYDGNTVSHAGTVIKVLQKENGEFVTDEDGQPLYISGTDHNNFTTYNVHISTAEKCYKITEALDQLINDVAAFGEITAEELSNLVYNN